MPAGLGLISNATSRYAVDVQPLTASTDTFAVQSLQMIPGVDGARIMKFRFTDSANRDFAILVTLSDRQFEAFNIFGGKKTPDDESKLGGTF
jgi:hypothetical protein